MLRVSRIASDIAIQCETNITFIGSRHTTYLRVARTHTLVFLASAGTLASSVRQFIAEELEIRVEVPALSLP